MTKIEWRLSRLQGWILRHNIYRAAHLIDRLLAYLADIFIDPRGTGEDHSRNRYKCANCKPDANTSCAECMEEGGDE